MDAPKWLLCHTLYCIGTLNFEEKMFKELKFWGADPLAAAVISPLLVFFKNNKLKYYFIIIFDCC
jgi:hypothetical protein